MAIPQPSDTVETPISASPALQTKYEACPLCEGHDFAPVLTIRTDHHPTWREPLPRDMTWLRCGGCSHFFSSHYWTAEAHKILFSQHDTHQITTGNIAIFRQAWKQVVRNAIGHFGGYEALKAKYDIPIWLDVGCGDGSLIMTAQEFGFCGVGIDMREPKVKFLRDRGYLAFHGEFRNTRLGERVHVISMMDLIEHTPFPRIEIEAARDRLLDDGLLIISTPNLDSSEWREMDRGRANPYWVEHEHHHNFTRDRLERVLRETGFAIVGFDIPARYKAQMEIYAQKRC